MKSSHQTSDTGRQMLLFFSFAFIFAIFFFGCNLTSEDSSQTQEREKSELQITKDESQIKKKTPLEEEIPPETGEETPLEESEDEPMVVNSVGGDEGWKVNAVGDTVSIDDNSYIIIDEGTDCSSCPNGTEIKHDPGMGIDMKFCKLAEDEMGSWVWGYDPNQDFWGKNKAPVGAWGGVGATRGALCHSEGSGDDYSWKIAEPESNKTVETSCPDGEVPGQPGWEWSRCGHGCTLCQSQGSYCVLEENEKGRHDTMNPLWSGWSDETGKAALCGGDSDAAAISWQIIKRTGDSGKITKIEIYEEGQKGTGSKFINPGDSLEIPNDGSGKTYTCEIHAEGDGIGYFKLSLGKSTNKSPTLPTSAIFLNCFKTLKDAPETTYNGSASIYENTKDDTAIDSMSFTILTKADGDESNTGAECQKESTIERIQVLCEKNGGSWAGEFKDDKELKVSCGSNKEKSTNFSVPSDGIYKVDAIVQQGAVGQCQGNEKADITIGNVTNSVDDTEDKGDMKEVLSTFQSVTLKQGNNTIKMKHTGCNEDSAGSIAVTKMCITPVETAATDWFEVKTPTHGHKYEADEKITVRVDITDNSVDTPICYYVSDNGGTHQNIECVNNVCEGTMTQAYDGKTEITVGCSAKNRTAKEVTIKVSQKEDTTNPDPTPLTLIPPKQNIKVNENAQDIAISGGEEAYEDCTVKGDNPTGLTLDNNKDNKCTFKDKKATAVGTLTVEVKDAADTVAEATVTVKAADSTEPVDGEDRKIGAECEDDKGDPVHGTCETGYCKAVEAPNPSVCAAKVGIGQDCRDTEEDEVNEACTTGNCDEGTGKCAAAAGGGGGGATDAQILDIVKLILTVLEAIVGILCDGDDALLKEEPATCAALNTAVETVRTAINALAYNGNSFLEMFVPVAKADAQDALRLANDALQQALAALERVNSASGLTVQGDNTQTLLVGETPTDFTVTGGTAPYSVSTTNDLFEFNTQTGAFTFKEATAPASLTFKVSDSSTPAKSIVVVILVTETSIDGNTGGSNQNKTITDLIKDGTDACNLFTSQNKELDDDERWGFPWDVNAVNPNELMMKTACVGKTLALALGIQGGGEKYLVWHQTYVTHLVNQNGEEVLAFDTNPIELTPVGTGSWAIDGSGNPSAQWIMGTAGASKDFTTEYLAGENYLASFHCTDVSTDPAVNTWKCACRSANDCHLPGNDSRGWKWNLQKFQK